MKYEFDFQMDEKTLTDFYMSYNMGGFSGFVWPVIGVIAIILAILSGDATPITYRLLYVIFGLLFIFYIPMDLKRKAKKQLKQNPVYAEPIHYILDEEGITTTQGENEATVGWENFSKMKLTKKSVILYMRNRNACVFAMDVFGGDLEEAKTWMKSKLGQK